MPHSLEIVAFDHDFKAVIKELPPGATVEDVRRAMNKYRIVNGIRWDAVEAAVAKATRENTTVANVVVVSADQSLFCLRYGKAGPEFTGSEVESVLADLSEIGRAIGADDTTAVLRNGLFVKSNEVAVTVRFYERLIDIYGSEVTVSKKPDQYARERTLALKPLPDGYQLVALVSGYVVVNQFGAFDICDPFVASDDRLTLYCRIVPMVYGSETFIDKIIRSAPATSVSATVADIAGPDDLPVSECLCKFELRHGKPPSPGRPGSVRPVIDADQAASELEAGRIDYHDISSFHEVKQGQLLVERVPMRQAIPGLDVFGRVIDIARVKDTFFSYGAGVVEEATPDLIRYTAAIDGILDINEHFVNVTPELIIHGDVCVTTGNIKYSRTVVIHGNVQAGFAVECADLTIHNSIEDNVRINCKGTLKVRNGIFGERTKVFVGGNAQIGLVQGAYVRVQGRCVIDKYAYQARVFCNNSLTVSGNGIIGREKGCIIGGDVCSMNMLDLHSVGSPAILTTLSCGFDPEGFQALKETLKIEKALKDKIIQLQNRIRFNPADKEQLIQRFQNATAERKDALKGTLQELRTAIAHVDKVSASVALLTRKSIASDISQAKILVRHQVIPQVLIKFLNLKKKIFRETSCIDICCKDDDVVIREGVTMAAPAVDDTPVSPPSAPPVAGVSPA